VERGRLADHRHLEHAAGLRLILGPRGAHDERTQHQERDGRDAPTSRVQVHGCPLYWSRTAIQSRASAGGTLPRPPAARTTIESRTSAGGAPAPPPPAARPTL